MKYKEFVSWCSGRACDGCWSSRIAMMFIEIIGDVRSHSRLPWRREKKWEDLRNKLDIESIIKELNDMRLKRF
jgi:hypothetical protein